MFTQYIVTTTGFRIHPYKYYMFPRRQGRCLHKDRGCSFTAPLFRLYAPFSNYLSFITVNLPITILVWMVREGEYLNRVSDFRRELKKAEQRLRANAGSGD